jgi:pimeloyl-ACP methyl ester carboxylesterase
MDARRNQTLDLEGRTLTYDEVGSANSAPVVLMHGLTDARTTWHAVVPRLVDHYQVFVYDHRGHGGSTHTPDAYRIGDYTSDAAAFIERVVGQEAGIVGHSLGGLTAANLAALRPDLVRCAFLEDPVIYLGSPEVFATTEYPATFPAQQRMLRKTHDRGDPVDAFETWLGTRPGLHGDRTMLDELGEESLGRVAATLYAFDPEALTPAIDLSLWAGFNPDRPIEKPVRVLRADPELGPCFFAAHAAPFIAAHKDVEIEAVSGASHAIHFEQADVFTNDLLRFLARHVPR